MNNELQSAPDATIRERFAARRAQGLRARDAAEALGLSEGAVIAAHAGAADAALRATALKGEWLAILQTLEACGTVMALTRNESTVHEKDGVYQHLSANGPIGLALSREIDLRLFFMHWHAGFAVTEASTQPGQAEARSLQFYDAHGTAVHKVYARAATDLSAWNALVERFATSEATPSFSQRPARKAVPPMRGSMRRGCAKPGQRCRTRTSSSRCCAASVRSASRPCGSCRATSPRRCRRTA